MPKYVFFSLFFLLSCGLSAQTFSFKDSADVAANWVDSYDVTYLRRAGGLINAMTFALNKKSDKFYKKLKGEFVLLTENAAVDFAEK